MLTDDGLLLRKAELLGVLERLCQGLELTDAQFQLAKERYEGVGSWLADAENPMLRALAIYLQGSTALGTTVKPISRNEHDVDLVAHIRGIRDSTAPAIIKKAIGDRLRLNGHYAPMLEELPRCWRLNYANEFHLDITPSIVNHTCALGGELVPDKKVKEWCASNPKGYKLLFEQRASLRPSLRLLEAAVEKRLRADIEPYPMSRGPKGILRRVVQILKRHRDYHFLDVDPSLTPISIVITTLASRSYEYLRIRLRVRRRVRSAVRRHPSHAPLHRDADGERSSTMVHLERNDDRRELCREVEPGRPPRSRVFRLARARTGRYRAADGGGWARQSDEVAQRVVRSRSGQSGASPPDARHFVGAGARPTGGSTRCWAQRPAARARNDDAVKHLLRREMTCAVDLPASLRLSSTSICGRIRSVLGLAIWRSGRLTWRFVTSPTAFSRRYRVRIEYRQGAVPSVFVEEPDLVDLAGGRRLPHVYTQKPPRLCLYLPGEGQWTSAMRLDQTVVPWSILWLFYFEEWLVSNEWKGGGVHPGDNDDEPADP